MKRRLFQSAIAGVVFLALAAPVLANSSFWSFTMNELVVNGESNGIYHQMTAGVLFNHGQIWKEDFDPGPLPPNASVTHIEVWKNNGLFGDAKVCGLGITARDDGVAKQFNKNCGVIQAGQYYIYAWKDFDDHRNIRAQGDLDT